MTPQEGMAHARQEARNLQRRFGVESAKHVDIQAFADRLNVQIVDAPLGGALAQLVVNGSSARILLSRRLRDPVQRRIAIAHELGHYVLSHPSPAIAELCERGPRRPHGSATGRDFEGEAHGFVLELFTPAAEVDAFCRARDPDLVLCAQLAISASVPIEHAAMRIAERSDRICAAVLSTSAGIAWAAPSRRFLAEFGSTLHEDLPLDPRTLAWRILDRSAPHAPAEVPADAWLGGPGFPLFESSAPVEGAILTMLWARRLEDVRASASNLSEGS
jgi:Zn-dependent peptidase ImmA (M78 family)